MPSSPTKIGILTYHRLVNRGSVLQAYSLRKRLAQELPGATVEVIDYSSVKMELLSGWRFFRNRAPILFDPHEIGEYRRMRRFIREHLAVSTEKLRSDSASRTMSWLAGLGYDAIVVGSDVVWEIQPRGYSIGGITPYHLPGATTYKKASFAVSMDPVVDYPPAIRPKLREMAEHITSFDFISVRDEATRGVLVDNGVPAERIRYMPDPTLLADIDELVGDAPWDRDDRFVLAVDMPERMARTIHAIGRRRGYSVWDWRHFGGRDVDRALPLNLRIDQILALYPKIDVLITDRFHSAIMASRIGRAGVVFVEHSGKWPFANSKGRDLFGRAGVADCVRRVEQGKVLESELASDIEQATDQASNLHAGLKRVAEIDGTASVAELRAVLSGAASIE
jgi:hypothetical protein